MCKKAKVAFYAQGVYNCLNEHGEFIGHFRMIDDGAVKHAQLFDEKDQLVAMFDYTTFLDVWKHVKRYLEGGLNEQTRVKGED